MIKLILTCEHCGNNVPAEYKLLFKNFDELLSSHRGYDIGAVELFNKLKPISDFNLVSETSRLLIELNRSLHHKNLFSVITKLLNEKSKQQIIKTYYLPYRDKVENKINKFIKEKAKVIHISVHTFTPVLNNKIRNCDAGLLYDPGQKYEKHFCKSLKEELRVIDNLLNVRFNYPYLGIADGFTSYLRNKFPEENYLGIGLEVNQKYFLNDKNERKKIIKNFKTALSKSIKHFENLI